MDKVILDLQILSILLFTIVISIYRMMVTKLPSIMIISLVLAIIILIMSIRLYIDWNNYDN